MEEVLKNYRILAECFKDVGTFYATIKTSYLAYKQNKENVDNGKFITKESKYFIEHLKNYIDALQREAGYPPYHRLLPLVYIAKTNLQGLIIQAKSFLKTCRETEHENVELALEAYNMIVAYYGSIYGEMREQDEKLNIEFRETIKVANSEGDLLIEEVDLIRYITIPFLQKLISEMEGKLETLNGFYGPFLNNASGDLAKGEETVYRMVKELANIKTEDDLFAFININSAGDLADKGAYRHLPESEFTPEQLAGIFYYLLQLNIITNNNNTALSRHISLLSGKSHNTIRTALENIVPNKKKLKSSILTETIKSEKNHNAEEIKRALKKICRMIDEDLKDYHATYS